jgi:hypothetical protein
MEGYCANEDALGEPDLREDSSPEDAPLDAPDEPGGLGCVNEDEDGYASEASPDSCPEAREPVECDSRLRPDNASRNPSAPEVCDGVDNDCDGLTDGDDPSLVAPACERQAGVCAGSKQRCVGGAFQPCGEAEYQEAAARNGGAYLDAESFCAAGGDGARLDAVGRCAYGVNPAVTDLDGAEAVLCDGLDNDCDGVVDDPDDTRAPCYPGAEGVELAGVEALNVGTGVCRAGARRCEGGAYLETCEGARGPAPEDSAELRCDEVDQDCDGQIREMCDCEPGEARPCYTGTDASRGFGECRDGTQRCQPNGTFGGCEGQVLPSAETCDNLGQDNDCDGEADNIRGFYYGASCGERSSYPDEETGFEGVCAVGELRCDPSCGDARFCCVAEARPGELPETCQDRNVDNDCDGLLVDLDLSQDEPSDQVAVGGTCQTGQEGICEEGRWGCPASAEDGLYPTCSPLYAPLAVDIGNGNPALDPDRVVATCNLLDDDCDGEVDEDTDYTLSPNCGECGVECGNNQDCCPPAVGAVASQYQCTTYRAPNDNIQGDRNNCGGCGFDQAEGDPHRCADDEACCGETCANLQTNPNHCGQCGRQCGNNQNCCNGNCISKSNRNNCGQCGNNCEEQPTTVCCFPQVGAPIYGCFAEADCD